MKKKSHKKKHRARSHAAEEPLCVDAAAAAAAQERPDPHRKKPRKRKQIAMLDAPTTTTGSMSDWEEAVLSWKFATPLERLQDAFPECKRSALQKCMEDACGSADCAAQKLLGQGEIGCQRGGAPFKTASFVRSPDPFVRPCRERLLTRMCKVLVWPIRRLCSLFFWLRATIISTSTSSQQQEQGHGQQQQQEEQQQEINTHRCRTVWCCENILTQSLCKQSLALNQSAFQTLNHHGRMCFDEMLQREVELGSDFVVFYHQYSDAALLYEVQAEIARALLRRDDLLPPLPRLLRKPFDRVKNATALKAKLSSVYNDHDLQFRQLAISCSLNVFGTGSEGTPMNSFLYGYSCRDLSFISLLINLFASCGMNADNAEKAALRAIDAGKAAGLTTETYRDKSGRACHGGCFTSAGHLLQIFVHRSVVNSLAYPCAPMGIPLIRPSFSSSSASTEFADHLETGSSAQGQARLLMDPAVFLDPRKARIFHYAGAPGYACPHLDSDARRTLHHKIRGILAPVLEDRAQRALAQATIGLPLTE